MKNSWCELSPQFWIAQLQPQTAALGRDRAHADQVIYLHEGRVRRHLSAP